MTLRMPLLMLVCAAFAVAGDSTKLDQPFSSSRAKRYRSKALAAWEPIQPTLDALQSNKEIEPDKMRETVAALEEAALNFERSLRVEWHSEVNDVLVDAVKAWFRLRELLPPEPLPEDPEEREDVEREREKDRKAELREARKVLIEALNARRPEKQLVRCRGCDGRGELRSAFGDKYKCKVCGGVGRHSDRDGILEAQYLPYSPVWRADPRKEMKVERALRNASSNPKVLAPFIKSVRVRGDIEDHGLWVRIHVKEKTYDDPSSRSTETAERSYILYSVGKLWYLHGGRIDYQLFEVPEEEEEEPEKKPGWR